MRSNDENENSRERLARHPAAMSLRHRTFLVASVLWAALPTAANAASAARATPLLSDNAETNTQIGTASWYGTREAGRRTASGVIFDPRQLTAAHRTLPLGTCVRVTDLGNGRFVIVPIIDRGPYIHGRLIDLSEAAAQTLGMRWAGLAQVRIDVVSSCLKEMKTRPIARLQTANALAYNSPGEPHVLSG